MVTDRVFRFVLFFVLLAGGLCAQVEVQRKYNVASADSTLVFVKTSGTLNGLFTHFHSEDVYYDLYLDTPDFALAQNHLSLRFRRRDFGDEAVSYTFQLKSEMENAGGLRMEVEEPELDFYTIKTKNRWTPLPDVLNVVFRQLRDNEVDPKAEEIRLATAQLQTWIQNNVQGPIIPFQKLVHMNLKGLSLQELKTLRPVMYGSSKRFRSHVFVDSTTSNKTFKNIPQNTSTDLPPFFRTTADDPNWLLEASLDFATFYPLIETSLPKVVICEYEVENKYHIRETGIQVMDAYEKGLKERFGATNAIDSKYLQSLKKFRGN
jgi:hypothetical protein